MPIKVYRRDGGKVWHYRGTVAGRRLRGTTGTTDRKIAERIASEAEAREWKRRLDGPGADVTFAQAAIAYRAAGKATRFLNRIEDFWRDTPVREISPGAVKQAALTLYPAATAATRNRQVIKPTAAIINFAAELDWCKPIRVKRFQEATTTKAPATAQWVEAFAAAAPPHLAALCLFMFGTGARVGEAVDVRWRDVDLEEATVTIRTPKIEDTRVAHLPPRVVAALANIPGDREPGGRVFRYAGRGSAKQSWDRVIDRAGIKRMTPHSCRHGFATAMLRAGVDVKTVARAGGWKDASTVLRTYAHALEDRTVTNAVFDTSVTRGDGADDVNPCDGWRKSV